MTNIAPTIAIKTIAHKGNDELETLLGVNAEVISTVVGSAMTVIVVVVATVVVSNEVAGFGVACDTIGDEKVEVFIDDDDVVTVVVVGRSV
jgi:hypothetical protein